MIKAKFCEFFGALSLIAPLLASAQSLPPEVEAVRNYLLTNDYPEVFSGKRYRVKIENIVVADLDGDGTPEVIAHVKPHFRQSPTIIIFKVGKDLHVQRVMEGLAPGPLQSVSGNYLDSHTLGEGVDFQAKMKSGYGAENGLVQGLVKSQKGGMVIYKNFAHLDGREGPPTYIDMRAADLPAGVRTCDDFEFSDVQQVEVTTRFSSDGRNVIAAHVGKKIYAIRIEHFLPDGLFEKSVTVQAL
jgi:hypothetical protein